MVMKFKFLPYFKTTPFRGSELWTALADTWQNQCRPRKKREHSFGKTIAKARPRKKPTVTLTSMSIPVLERIWIDIETQDQTIKSVSKCQKQSLDHCNMINQFLEESTERCTTMTSLKSAGGRSSTTLRSGYLKIGYQNWKGRRSEEQIQYFVNPNSRRTNSIFLWIQTPPINSWTFEQFKDILLKVLLILHCKTINKLIPKGFTEYLYHVGNANELNFLLRDGLIPGGTSLKRGRQVVFFTTVNPMEDVHGTRETPCDLTKPSIAPYKNTWKRFQNTVFWCNSELAQERERGLQFFTNRGHTQSFCTTHCLQLALRKRYVWKLRTSSTNKVRLTPRVPRVVLKSNSQYGLQDPQNQDARSSWEPSGDSKSNGETCNSTVDHRTAGELLSAVEPQKTTRENKVKTVIEKLENHKKNCLFRNWDRRKRSTRSAKNRKIWSPTWTTLRSSNLAKILPNSNVLTAMPTGKLGIICCSCGRNMKSTRTPTEFDQNNRDVTSIPGYVIKKNRSRGAKRGAIERQKMYFHAKQMLKKARQRKHGGHPTILSRWYADEEYRKSLSDIGWREHHIILYDRIAPDTHIYKATRAERIQMANNWILTASSEGGTQLPLNQRPNCAQAKNECKRLHDEHLSRTQQEYRDIPHSQRIRQRKGQQFVGHEELDYAVDPNTGWRFYRQSRWNLQTSESGSRANLQAASSSSSTWDQTQWKTSNCNSQHSSSPDKWWFFLTVRTGCLEKNLQPTDGVCEQYTHKYSTYRVGHSIITFHHANTRGSR